MKKENLTKLVTGATSAVVLLAGCAPTTLPQQAQAVPAQAEAVAAQQESVYALSATEGKREAFTAVKNVQGAFSFDQDQLTPADEAFNLFGTVLTGMCAKPAFALENDRSDFYVNVGGQIKKSYSVSLRSLAEKEQTTTMLCSCATGPASANVRATGVPVSDILQLTEDAKEVNAISFVSSDGYSQKLPLSYVLEKKAMIVYQVNGERVPSGTQLYIPETVAKYFTRDVVDIELSKEEVLPEVEQRDEKLRAEVTIKNYADGCTFRPGETVTFEGYADDLGDPIAAVEFSLDGGESWTSYETEGATAERWVYWHFDYQPEAEGTYQLSVRARTESGRVSPLAASLTFHVAK